LSCAGILGLSFTVVDTAPLLSLPFLQDDLARLEPELRVAVRSGDPFLDEVTTHLIAAGGKRLRPCLALAAATLGRRPATSDDLQGAVAVELVHLASLYHDDVMDEALVRRNVESVNARWGNLVAIVAGDFLLARSAEIAASLGTEIAGLLANTLGLLCQGQVTEVRAAFSTDRTEADYLTTIEGKTAALMATSCRIGALTGGLPRTEVDVLTRFGRCFGVLFQLRDDILDVVASDEELGKPAGQDLAEGIYTLPVLLALRDPATGPELRPLLGQPLDQPERDKARAIVAGSGAIAATVATGRRYVDEALAAAAAVGDQALGPVLGGLAHSLLEGLPVSR
jgi:heptaprenyl diphosphate synthase